MGFVPEKELLLGSSKEELRMKLGLAMPNLRGTKISYGGTYRLLPNALEARKKVVGLYITINNV
jgi:hypothetical protein